MRRGPTRPSLARRSGSWSSSSAAWRSDQINAFELSDHIHVFHQGPARELWSRYNARIDDTLVAHAIVTDLLPRETIPAELLEALQPIIAFYEREGTEPEQEAE